MTLQEQFQQALNRLAPFSDREELIEVQGGTQLIRCELMALDTLACSFTKLGLRTVLPADRDATALEKTAKQLAARLTYLLEPISSIECDAQGCIVQMRSNPPYKESDRTSYYELLISRDGEINLCRYSRPAGNPRQRMPAQVTREVLLRLVADFSAVAS